MGFEMKTEKDVLSKDQCKVKSPNPNSVNSPHIKKKKKKKKNKSKKTKKTSPPRKRSDSPADEITAVRRLFDTCKEVFSDGGPGVIPSLDKIQQLRDILDNMKPEDVGLTPTMPYFRPDYGPESKSSPPITYLHLHQCEQFSIGIFCLPPSGVIPLHNHPGMTVFSKLLFGTMHIKSYDWVVDAPMRDSKTRLAKLKMDSTLTAPCNASILYPEDGGNMHRFTARTACAVLDVLGPPYCNPEGRHCTYFLEFPLDNFSSEEDNVLRGEVEKEGHAWLQERDDKPDDLNVVGALYTGPKVED
ncbi:Plant cysteine oxidase 1 [Raphanus sativus]|uniref:cysteine dioxygenase n=1 Tax=Raphanus sativus TaxID=3726 RepID=A0A6J0MQV1_RAPSA|nr:plant cysteine oxidase 1-like isoform X2 [Raphanus sativus]KAJ4908323.1 Plant cysteine oxidase 1 [Raphanus sativus]